MNNLDKSLIVFKNKNIRRIWFKDEWYYSLVDIIQTLTESINPTDYLKKLRKRDEELRIYLGTNCPHVEMSTLTEKKRTVLAGNTKDIFRIIQSIPSKNAEPFKRWLANVGKERIDEIENPELAQIRMKEIYSAKGYSKDWIDKRLRGIAIRQNLTDEWKNREVDRNIEYAILTNEISKATFGKTISEYKELKNLDNENLRDHMDELELIFGMLGEKVATEITISKDAKGFDECSIAAKQGGEVAGNARKEAEEKIGLPIVSEENYLERKEKEKKGRGKKKILAMVK